MASTVAWATPAIVSVEAAAAATCSFSPRLIAGGGSDNNTGQASFVAVGFSGSTPIWWNAYNNGGNVWCRLSAPATCVAPPAAPAPPSATFAPSLLAGGGDNSGVGGQFVTTNGIGSWFRSADGGRTWTLLTAANSTNINGFPAQLLAGFGNVGGNGADFVAFNNGIAGTNRWRYSINGGQDWTETAAANAPPATFLPSLLAGGGDNDANRSDFVTVDNTQAAANRVYASQNAGANWAVSTFTGGAPNVTWSLLAGGDDINGSFVLYGQGVWRFSSDGGITFAAPAAAPPASFVPSLLAGSGDNDGTAPAGGDFVAYGLNNGTPAWYRSSNFGNNWSTPATPPPVTFRPTLLAGVGDGGNVNDFVAYGSCQWYRSYDGGNNWAVVATPPT